MSMFARAAAAAAGAAGRGCSGSLLLRLRRPQEPGRLLSSAASAPAPPSKTAALLVNAVGRDRLGIVADVAGAVVGAGGSVGDSRAARLGGHFALLLRVEVPAERRAALAAALEALPGLRVTALLDEASDDGDHDRDHGRAGPAATPRPGYRGRFTLEGADHPGIVHTVTLALARHGLSIEALETDQAIAPHGGTVLFRMRGTAVAYAPLAAGFAPAKIRDDLQALGARLNCDLDLEEEPDDAAASGSFYGG